MKAVADTRKPYSGLSRSLVIAIDVGTTFSGVSYAILEPGDIPKIHGVTRQERFPGQEYGIGNSKIPSVIYYDKRGEMMAAGAEADNANTQVLAEDEGWIKVELFKLRLRPRTMHLSMNGLRLAPLPPRKSPVHIFGDFLSYLYNCTLSFIRDTHANGGALLASIIPDRLEFVLAHPNGWEGAQQAKMRRAAVYGGLVSGTPEGRAKIRFVTEGEASLHACVLSGLAADVLSNPSKHGFLIADAGGGTLDISSYAIKGTHPLVMEEIAPPDCIFAGSVFVSRRAREFFEHKLKGSQYGTPVTLDHITKRFDETTKRLFRDRRDVQFVPFGSPIDKDPAYGIRTGQLRLTGAEVANLFEPSVDAAFNAIKKQIEACNGMIKSVFLVGGYAASPWLFTQLQERLASLNVVISRPDTQTSKAVADGAIGFYCDHHVSARMSKFMYGVEYLRQLDPNDPEHLARQEKLCELPSGPKLLPDAFDCILARGVKVKESTVFTRKYCTELTSLSMLKVFEVEIWCYRGGNTIPKWIERQAENFSTLCIVRADLSMLSDSASAKVGRNNKTYWTIVFSVEIHFGLTEFKARIKWVQNGETKYGPATIVYNERGHRSDEDEPDFFPEDDAITGNEPSRDGDRELTRSGSRPRTPVDGHYIDPSRRSTKDRESVRAPSIKNGSAPPTPIRAPSINLEKDRINQYEMERKKSIASDRERSVPPTPILDRSRSTRNTIAQPSSPAPGGVTPSIYSTRSRPRTPTTPGLEYVDPPHPPSHRASPAKPGHSALFDSTAPRSSSVFDTATPPKSIFSEDPQSAFGTHDILGSGGDRPKSIFDNEAENPAAAIPPAAMGVFDQSPAGLDGDKNGGGLWGDSTWGGSASQAPATPAPPTPALLTPAVPAESTTLPPTASPALSTKSSKKKTPRGSPAISRANSGQGAAVATPLATIGENAFLGSKVSSPVTKPLSPLNPASQQAVPEATPAPTSEDLPAPTPVTSVPATPAPVQAAVPPIEIPAPTVHSSTPGTPAEERTPITPTASGKKKKRKGSGAVAAAAAEKEKGEEEKKKEEEELRKKAEEELKKKVEEDELKRKAEEDTQMRREEEEKKQGEEKGRKAKEAEARQKEEDARKEKEKLEQDAKEKEEKERLEKEEKERLEHEEKERLQQEEADRKAKAKADREEKKKREKEEKERKKREEEERKKKEEEERLEKERLEKEERERKKKEKEEKRKKKEEEERKKQEEEARKKEEEDRLKAEEERKQKEEEERMKKEEERKQKEEEARLKAEEEERQAKEEERLNAEAEQARQRAEDARLQAEKEEDEREMRRFQEEEDRVKRELEDLERQEKLAQEKSERERKEKESNPLGFSFGGASSLFGNVSTSLFGNSSTNFFGSENEGQQEEPTGLDWGFGSAKKNPKTPVETPQQQSRQSPFGWGGGSTFGGLDDKPTSTSLFSDVNVNPVFDQIAVNDPAKQPEEGLTATKALSRATSPKPATPKLETPKPEVEVTQAEATEATEDDWGAWPAVTKGKKKKGNNASNNASQQPTRAPSPQPPADPAANAISLAEENLEGNTWGHTAKGKKKGKNGKNGESEQPTRAPTPPPDAADAKNEDNLQDQLSDLLDNQDAAEDDWGAQPAGKKNKKKNKGGALDPEPEPPAEKVEEKDDLLDFLEGNNEPKEQKDDGDEWALPAKGKKKKKGKNAGNDDADPPTPIEKPADGGLAAVGSGKKKKKGKK